MMIARNSSRKRSGSDSQFPGRLHDLMEYIEENRIEHVISWVLKGRGFIVQDPDRLVELLPLFFSQTKYRSFRRQLNMWHFERIEKGPCKGAFIHPYFVRGNRDLCHSMSRHISLKPQRASSIGSNGSSSCSMQSFLRSQKETVEGDNSETLPRRGHSCPLSDVTAVLCQQNSYHVEDVPSTMNVPSFLSSSPDVILTSTERSTTFDTPDHDSFLNSDIDLPFIEPDPIRAVIVDSAAMKNATKSLSSLSKVPSYHQLEPTMTVANFLKEALFTQPITAAINDMDFLCCSEQDDRAMMNNCYCNDDQRIAPSFIMPRGPQNHRVEKTMFATMATVPPSLKISSLPYRQVSEETVQNQHSTKEHQPSITLQSFDDGLFFDDHVYFVDFDHHERR